MSSTWQDARDSIETAIAKQKWNKALRLLAPTLSFAGHGGAHWGAALGALAAAAEVLGDEVAVAAKKAAAQPDDGAALYSLGHGLLEARRPELAIAALAHAVELEPTNAARLAELIAALELLGRNREVVALLDRLDGETEVVQGSSLLTYLRAFNAFMVGDVETPERLLPQLEAAEGATFAFMAARIQRMLARAHVVKAMSRLKSEDSRAWHYVLTAGILFRTGRYERTWDAPARVREGLGSLLAVLQAWQLHVPAVLYPPERNSEITARAAAELLGCDASPWHGGGEVGLLVVYDARMLIPELREALVQHRPNQPLFMQAAEYTAEQPTAPDLLTYRYAHNTSPWGPGLTVENKPIDTTRLSVNELAQSVVHATDTAPTELAELSAFAAALRDVDPAALPAGLQESGQRERLWRESSAD